MAKKNRFPQQFGWEDFLTFMRELLSWLGSQVGQPDHQPSLEVGLADLVDDYEAGLITYAAKKNLAPQLRAVKDNAMKALREALIRVKMTLPVFFDEPSVLGEFNLAQDIESDEDDLYIQASACLAHWDVVKALPEYAGMIADMTVVEDGFADFVSKRNTYSATFQAMQAAQNDLIDLRAPIQDMERKIFDWYRSRYRNAQHEFWTETPWGTASGGSGGGGEPQPGSWEDAPTNFVLREGLPGSALLTADVHRDAEGCAVFMAETALGDPVPPMVPPAPINPLITPIEPGKFSYNLNITANVRVWFWICHVKEGAWGAMTEPKWIEIVK
jgi:hypothetical protein